MQTRPVTTKYALNKRYLTFLLCLYQITKEADIPKPDQDVRKLIYDWFKSTYLIERFYVAGPILAKVAEVKLVHWSDPYNSKRMAIPSLPISFFKKNIEIIKKSNTVELRSESQLVDYVKDHCTEDSGSWTYHGNESTQAVAFFEVESTHATTLTRGENAVTASTKDINFTNILVIEMESYSSGRTSTAQYNGDYPKDTTQLNKSGCSIM